MVDAIVVALITGGLSLIGVIITNLAGQRRTEQRMATAQAVTDTKIEELTREVRAHNNFAQRVPVLEEQIKVANHRITDGLYHETCADGNQWMLDVGPVSSGDAWYIMRKCAELQLIDAGLYKAEYVEE